MRYLLVHIFLSLVISACSILGEDEEPAIPGKIVFSAKDDSDDPTYQIFTMNADGSDMRQLTDGEFSATSPAWSPDGARIAFASNRQAPDGKTTLWEMEADGGNPEPLVRHPQTGRAMFGNHPAWSPDGRKVAFHDCIDCELGGGNEEIFLADLQAGTLDTLVRHPSSDSHPTWSPDGSRIAFGSRRDYFDADTLRFREDLYMINIDGTDLQRLTQNGKAARPAWSPNEFEIAYEWSRGGNNVFLFKISVGEITDIDTGLQFSGNVMWTKNGTKLLVSGRKSEGSQPKLRLLNIEVEPPEILQNLVLDENSVGRDYDWYTD